MREKKLLEKISLTHSYGEGFNGRLAKYRALKIKELYRKGGSLLDIGAGEGFLTRLIAGMFHRIEIIEASPVFLKKAEKLLAGWPVTFHNCLIEEFETRKKFDLVVASGVLEHVRDPQIILKKAKGWIKKEGLLVAIVPNATSLHRQVGKRMGITKDCYELGETLREEVQRAGFNITGSGGILLKPLPDSDMEKLGEAYCDALYEIGEKHEELCAEIFVGCAL